MDDENGLYPYKHDEPPETQAEARRVSCEFEDLMWEEPDEQWVSELDDLAQALRMNDPE